jgi:hypothetical protein
MKLLDVIIAADGRVSGGDPYLWKCFGEDANFMEFRDADGKGFSHCVYDTRTYVVYQIHIEVPGTEQCFQWINPEWEDVYFEECLHRDVDPREAWDDVKYDTIKDASQILTYMKDIGATYYDNLPIAPEQMTLEMPGTLGSAKIVFSNENIE